MANHDQNLCKLMAAVQKGDQTAYRELLKRVKPVVCGIIGSRIRQYEVVEDVYQNTLLKMHVSRHTYDASQPFEPWLYAVTRSVINDYLRSYLRTTAKNLNSEDGVLEVAVPAESDLRLQLEQALNVLSEEQRRTIELVKIEGVSMEEGAKREGVSLSAFKVRAHRAYKVLKDALSSEESE